MEWLKFLLKRKLLVGLLVVFILFTGVYSTSVMNSQLLPSVSFDMAAVYVDAGQMSALDVEKKLVEPIEQRISAIDGVEAFNSTTSLGISSIQITMEKGKGKEVYEKIESSMRNAEKELPGVKSINSYLATTDASFEFFMDIYGSEDLEVMSNFAAKVLKPRLEALPEVREVKSIGLIEKEVVVELKQKKLTEAGVGIHEIIQILQSENQNVAIGQLAGETDEPKLRWNTSFANIENIKNVTIPSPKGIKKLKDLATVEIKDLDGKTEVWKDGDSNYIFVQIGRASDFTQIEMAKAVRAEVEKIRKEGYVNGFEFKELVAQADYVSEAITGVKNNIIIGGLLALVILLVFLRNVRATIIIGLSIPISLLLTFTAMWVFGYSINMLSLIALGLGIGMMVDASIVILESIYRKRELGQSGFSAVIDGTREVSAAVIASMLTTIVVFLPIGLLSGEMGQFMMELSAVVIITLVSSVLISFTLIPIMSEKFLKLKENKRNAPTGVLQKYGQLISWMSQRKLRRWGIAFVFILVFGASLFLLKSVPLSLMPDVYNRQAEILIMLKNELKPGEREEIADAVHQKLQNVQDVASYTVSVESGYVFIFANMTSKDDATLTQKEVNSEIMKGLRDLEKDFPISSVGAAMSAGSGGYPVQIEIKGKDYEKLEAIAKELTNKLRTVEGLEGVNSSIQRMYEERQFVLKTEKIKKAGLIPSQIREQISFAFNKQPVGQIDIDDTVMPINIKIDQEIKTEKELYSQKIITIAGTKKLSEFIELKTIELPTEISHIDGERVVKVMADIEGRDLGSVNLDVQKVLDEYETPMGYSLSLAGDLETQQEAFTEIILVLLIALFLVYLVMAVQFNSLVHPLVVMSIIPMTFVGVILGLLITQRELNIISAVGVIMLIGIVLNNAILLIDRTKQLRAEGASRGEALSEAGRTRMRPIFMTTLTTAFGMLPLAMATGNAANFQTPMATVVISGLLFATFITLILIPAVYMISEDILQWPKRIWNKKKEQKLNT